MTSIVTLIIFLAQNELGIVLAIFFSTFFWKILCSHRHFFQKELTWGQYVFNQILNHFSQHDPYYFSTFFKGNFTNIVFPSCGRPKNFLFFFQYTKRNKLFEKLDWEVRFFVEENLIFRRGYAKISTYDLGLYFFTEGRTDKEVVFLYNFRSPPPFPHFFSF